LPANTAYFWLEFYGAWSDYHSRYHNIAPRIASGSHTHRDFSKGVDVL